MACFDDCTNIHKKAELVVREKQRVAHFLNPEREALALTRFDGCVDCAGKRADYVLAASDGRKLIIELKGRDVEGAGNQIINTNIFLRTEGRLNGKPSALIVCSKVPLGVSSVQRLAAQLKAAGLGSLKVKTDKWVGHLSDLI